jgi:hypothetical protein
MPPSAKILTIQNIDAGLYTKFAPNPLQQNEPLLTIRTLYPTVEVIQSAPTGPRAHYGRGSHALARQTTEQQY